MASEGLEPSRPYGLSGLNAARLPIPPRGQIHQKPRLIPRILTASAVVAIPPHFASPHNRTVSSASPVSADRPSPLHVTHSTALAGPVNRRTSRPPARSHTRNVLSAP